MKMKKSFLFFVLFLSSAFAEGNWDRAYLATYPRSGNSWMRFLIEELTDVATCTVYKHQGRPLIELGSIKGFYLSNGFNDKRRSPEKEDLIVVKTHYPYLSKASGDKHPYSKTIRIVRNPVDSFYSLMVWNEKNEGIKPNPIRMVKEMVRSWRAFQEYWDKMENVYTIRYEDLMEDPFNTLKGVAEELRLDCTDEDIERAVQKYPPQGEVYKHLHHFSDYQLNYIRWRLADLLEEFDYDIPRGH